jgi:uncharacterized protein with HEPN domain
LTAKAFEEFQGNRMLQLVIEREFEIIGEAAMWDFAKNRVPELVEKVKNY